LHDVRPRAGDEAPARRRKGVRRYRDVWVTATTVVLLVGAWADVLTLGTAAVVTTFFAGCVLGGCALLMAYDFEHPRCTRAHLAVETAVIGVAVVAACGYVVALGPVAVVPVSAPLITCPWAVRRAAYFARLRRTPDESPLHEPPPEEPVLTPAYQGGSVALPPQPAPATMDLEELCLAWRRSYLRLQTCRTVAERLQVVAERQQCLDEMELRNPGGLSAWLESGARAAGDPTRYVTPDGPSDCRDAAA
jgi:hypothetical protein